MYKSNAIRKERLRIIRNIISDRHKMWPTAMSKTKCEKNMKSKAIELMFKHIHNAFPIDCIMLFLRRLGVVCIVKRG